MCKNKSRKDAETQRLRKENLKKLCDSFAASRLCVRFFFVLVLACPGWDIIGVDGIRIVNYQKFTNRLKQPNRYN
jgi:hypothetical protein